MKAGASLAERGAGAGAQDAAERSPAGTQGGAERPHAGAGRFFFELAVLVVAVVALTLLVKTFFIQPFWIPSGSMEPELMINDRVLVSKLAYDLHAPRRGDIVVFVAPPQEQKTQVPPQGFLERLMQDIGSFFGVRADKVDFIKRVIGLPGDVVEARGGHVYIDGRLLVEPYLPRGTYTSTFGPVKVPPGHLWVMGDNRTDSSDSRVFGPIPESSVIGRAFLRFWPPWRIAFI